MTGNRARKAAWIGATIAAALSLGALQAQAEQTPERKLAPIDWPKAEADAAARRPVPIESGQSPRGVLLQFSPAQLARAGDLEIPLLMPKSLLDMNRRNQLDVPLTLESDKTNYSSEAQLAPRSYLVSGTRVVFEIKGGVKAAPPATDDVYVEIADWGVEATFERYGAMYSISIYCAQPQTDPECTQEDRVRELAAEMVLATKN